jgi:NitT/TauT family transport system permease protein
MSRRSRVMLARALVILLPAGIYELLCRVGILDPFSWVPVSTTVVQWFKLITNSLFLITTVWPTLRIVLLAAMLAIVTGVIAGTVLWRFPLIYRIANTYLALYYSVPAFAFYPIVLSLLGAGPQSLILLSALLGSAAMTANVALGLNSTPSIRIKLGRVVGLGFARMLWHIYYPAALPQMLVGVRLSIAYSVIGVVGGEFLAGTRGLGYYIQFSYNSFSLANTYAGVLVVIVLSLLLNGVLYLVSSLIYPAETIGK